MAQVQINSGTVYWIAWFVDAAAAATGGQFSYSTTASTNQRATITPATYPNFPSSASGLTYATQVWSIYGVDSNSVTLLGDANVETNTSSEGSDSVTLIKFTAVASGLLNELLIYVNVTGGNVVGAIYSDNGGVPDLLLGDSSATPTALSSTGWVGITGVIVPPVSNIGASLLAQLTSQ